MTTLTAKGQAAGLIEKAELNRFVTIALQRANLENATRAGLNDRDGNGVASLVINLCHPDLSAEYTLGHRNVSYGLVVVPESKAAAGVRFTRQTSSRYKRLDEECISRRTGG